MNVAESNSGKWTRHGHSVVAQLLPDTITACTFQLQEVFTNYRQSGDPGSKRRVREACNAAITGLPDWPSPLS